MCSGLKRGRDTGFWLALGAGLCCLRVVRQPGGKWCWVHPSEQQQGHRGNSRGWQQQKKKTPGQSLPGVANFLRRPELPLSQMRWMDADSGAPPGASNRAPESQTTAGSKQDHLPEQQPPGGHRDTGKE